MKSFSKKKPINERWVVKRRIPVVFPETASNDEIVKRLLELSNGVVFADFNIIKGLLNIHYDVTQVVYGDILKEIQNNGEEIRDSYWFRWKKGWIEFAETNMRENAKAPPSTCCNKPPK